MTSNMQVDRAEMAKAAGQIEEKAGTIHNIQSTLNGQISSLMRGWQGQAAQAFFNAYNEFDQQFVQVQQALEDIHSKLTESHMSYVQTEDQNQQASSQIMNALNG